MIYLNDSDFTLYNCDVLEGLAQLEDESVHCVVTSPPYWGLRDYSAEGQLGLEPTPEAYIERMVEVFREVRRVLRKDGTCWVNMGDCYASGGDRKHGGWNGDGYYGKDGEIKPQKIHGEAMGAPMDLAGAGLKAKDLCMVPAKLAIALQADGWYLRSQIVWAKPNPMPESVSDRPTSAYEFVYLLTRSPRYFYDQEAVREPSNGLWNSAKGFSGNGQRAAATGYDLAATNQFNGTGTHENREQSGRNLRNVWEIPTEPYPDAHFATYPTELVRRCILAGTSERGCCPECGAPWVREVDVSYENGGSGGPSGKIGTAGGMVQSMPERKTKTTETTGWRPSCGSHEWPNGRFEPIPCTVFDPFMGSGTTALVARKLGRRCVGIELNPEYCQLAARRTSQLSLLGEDVYPTERAEVSRS